MRNGGQVVVGQAYEEDCWTRYQKLYFDGWWSPITHTGTNLAWRTAGRSGTDDYIRDVAQLHDGKIAFIGNKGGTPDSGLWVFVTDSTAETIQWQKQFNLPGIKAGRDRNDILPYSIVATSDSRFIVAGEEIAPNQHSDACVLKFVPRPIPTSFLRSIKFVPQLVGNGNRVLRFEATAGAVAELKILSIQGKEMARYRQRAGQDSQVRFEIREKLLERSVYLWEIKCAQVRSAGSFVVVE